MILCNLLKKTLHSTVANMLIICHVSKVVVKHAQLGVGSQYLASVEYSSYEQERSTHIGVTVRSIFMFS